MRRFLSALFFVLLCCIPLFADLPENVYEDKGKFVGLSVLEWQNGLPYNLKNRRPCANIAVYVRDGKNSALALGRSFTVVADYEGDDWIFMERIVFECGEKSVSLNGTPHRKVIDSGVHENLHCEINKYDVAELAAMCSGYDTVTVYLSGEWSTPKYKLSKKQKRDIAALAAYYETLE